MDRDQPSPVAIDDGASVLRRGGLVAFATETVYGLGADATDPAAVTGIFEAKGRPVVNPLIVHADGPDMARSCVASWPEEARILAKACWPGPLTLVLARSARIPDVVTAGQETVGVRVPDTRVARSLIARTGRPVAAPSANRSTGISPTSARHVLKDLDGRIDLILDSGPTSLGLESTVVDLSGDSPRLLRPGPFSREFLAETMGKALVAPESGVPGEPALSPGQMAIHYAPRTPTVRIDPGLMASFPWPARSALIVVGRGWSREGVGALFTFELPTPETAAAGLYATLHHCDESGLELIVIVPPPCLPQWSAILDRLGRASVPFDSWPAACDESSG